MGGLENDADMCAWTWRLYPYHPSERYEADGLGQVVDRLDDEITLVLYLYHPEDRHEIAGLDKTLDRLDDEVALVRVDEAPHQAPTLRRRISRSTLRQVVEAWAGGVLGAPAALDVDGGQVVLRERAPDSAADTSAPAPRAVRHLVTGYTLGQIVADWAGVVLGEMTIIDPTGEGGQVVLRARSTHGQQWREPGWRAAT